MTPDTPASHPAAGRTLLWGGLGALSLVRLWILPLGSSLSLDEFGTWWVTNGRFDEILARARLFPQSVPYAVIEWIARAIGGSREIALRLPSLLAAGLAAYCLYRLGRDLFDRETGLLATGIFIGVPQVCYAAGDARPYAFAVLATVAALWMLVRWLDRSSVSAAVAYVVCASVAVYFQYLFATMLVAHAAYAIRRCRRGGGFGARPLLLAAAGIAVLTAPATMLALEVGRDRALHAFGTMPGLKALVLGIVPTSVLAALAGGLAASWLVSRFARRPWPWKTWDSEAQSLRLESRNDALWLLGFCALLPPVLLFLVSRVEGAPVFVDRYWLCAVPAQVLLMAWCLKRGVPPGGRSGSVAAYLLIMILARGVKIGHTNEDWRGAAAAVRAAVGGTPVLLSGTYTESRSVAWVKDERHAAYMRAPLDYYAPGGPIQVLPLLVGQDAESYVQSVVDAAAGLGNRFALVERSSRFPSWAPWLDARLGARGYRMRTVWDHGNPNAWLFERPSPPGGASH